jgi:hypothetical protein
VQRMKRALDSGLPGRPALAEVVMLGWRTQPITPWTPGGEPGKAREAAWR